MAKYIVSVFVNTEALEMDEHTKSAAEKAVEEALHEGAQIDFDQMQVIGCEIYDSEEEDGEEE